MKILFVASEATPLAKVGGLADVIGSLPKALRYLGHDVRVVIPKYGIIDDMEYPATIAKYDFKVSMPGETLSVNLNMTTLDNKVVVYMVENLKYFGGKEVYNGKDDLERFLFFSRAVFAMLPQLEWQPEIIHCHDWHTSLIIMWLKQNGYPYISLFTIHNLAYQGPFDETFLVKHELSKYWADRLSDTPKLPLNFIVQGIWHADLVTTVSKTYAKEILIPPYGMGLDAILNYRKKSLVGIINGIDYEEYNPLTDPYILSNYDCSTLEKKCNNKLALQREVRLPEAAEIPVIGMVQRLDEQKGLDLLEKAIASILKETDIQLVIQGRGSEHYENMLRQIASQYPQRVSAFIAFDNSLAHRIYAGCDMFLMPSRFEPCGLGQLIAMRYGALPIVHHTGGLIDTVTKLTPNLIQGSGFVFQDYNPEALIFAVKEAVKAYSNKKAWRVTMQRVMGIDFSWQTSALQYDKVYRKVLEEKARA